LCLGTGSVAMRVCAAAGGCGGVDCGRKRPAPVGEPVGGRGSKRGRRIRP
jgi:hypothetical protein